MSDIPDPSQPAVPEIDPSPSEAPYPEITPDPSPLESPVMPDMPDTGQPYA